jgi:hypothetical protein
VVVNSCNADERSILSELWARSSGFATSASVELAIVDSFDGCQPMDVVSELHATITHSLSLAHLQGRSVRSNTNITRAFANANDTRVSTQRSKRYNLRNG